MPCAVITRCFIRRGSVAADALAISREAWREPTGAYLAGMATCEFDGPNGPCGKRFSDAHRQGILGSQIFDGDCNEGSWSPAAGLSRTTTTALRLLTLELTFGRVCVFQSKPGGQKG